MRKAKKLLGFACLAAVGLMTAVAYCLPTPEAAAQAADVNINVTVRESHASVHLVTPKDGDQTVRDELAISTDYTETLKIEYSLVYTAPDGHQQTFDLPSYTPAAQDGTHDFTVDLSSYGFGNYTLTAKITGVGGVTFEDAVKFEYCAVIVEQIGTDEWGNPIVKIYANPKVAGLTIPVYDENGKALAATPLRVADHEFDASHIATVTIPMDTYSAPAGDYLGLALPYDAADNLLKNYPFEFTYTPVVKVPNTGLTLSNLNITKADYLLTGLVMFGAVAGFAIFLVARKSRR